MGHSIEAMTPAAPSPIRAFHFNHRAQRGAQSTTLPRLPTFAGEMRLFLAMSWRMIDRNQEPRTKVFTLADMMPMPMHSRATGRMQVPVSDRAIPTALPTCARRGVSRLLLTGRHRFAFAA